jgi:hypothetical protein
MTAITRTWLAMAAIAAGLIHVALGAGAPLALGVPLIAIAVAEMAWGAATVVRDRVPFRNAALLGALAPVALWAGMIVAASVSGTPELLAPLPFLAMGSATLFSLFVACVLAVHRRRALRATDPAAGSESAPNATSATNAASRRGSSEPSVGRYLLGVLAGAAVMSALTTPALANTHAGQSAVPHGTSHGVHSDH